MTKIGAGIIAIDSVTGRILMGRRGLKVDDGNCYAPFGGTFEERDEIPKNTAIREFREETDCKAAYRITKRPFYINEDNHISFYTYVGIFPSQFDVKINNEHLDYDWFDINHLPENLHPGVKMMLDEKIEDLKRIIKYAMGS